MPDTRDHAPVAIGAAIFLACLLAGAVWTTSALVERAVERDASRRSVEWARYAAENIPRIEALAAGALPTDAEWEVIRKMADFGGLFRYKLFSPAGVLRFDTDRTEVTGAALGAHNPSAARVLSTGGTYTIVADGRDKPDRPALYSETYLPIMDESGRVLAVAETYLDQTQKTAAVRREYLIFGAVMLAIILLALAVPSLALLVLLRRLRARNRELNRERLRALEADRAKTQFLATVSHELRTPMNGIIGVAQLLENSGLSEEDTELLDILKTCSESQLTLIEEILTFGALEAGQLRLDDAPVDLGKLVRTATGFATIASAEKGLSFNLTAPEGGSCMIRTDAKRLQQVLVNLVGNAVKFTDVGQVDVSAKMHEGASSDMGLLCIAVRDTGPGIPIEEQDRIFERFTQVDTSSTRRAGGTGLGLAIARAIVREMGGDVTVSSQPGQGATFEVQVPVRRVVDMSQTDEIGRKAA